MSLIKLSNGIEISEDTIMSALKKVGIGTNLPEPTKYIFRAGDIAKNKHGKWRLIVSVGGILLSVDEDGRELLTSGQEKFEHYGYQFIGRLKDL